MNVAPTVSVIVPIYNVEDYLEECLDSIIGQTLESLEIICINDGSTDGSLEILRRYEKQDSRIVVIDKENGGYGKAVNCGLEHATGEWIAIVEPDDFIDEHMYEDLVRESTLETGGTAEIVKSGYWLYFDLDDGMAPFIERPALNKCMRCYRYEFNVYDDSEVLYHHPSIWSAIYRRDFIQNHDIRMVEPRGAGWADNPWLYETMLQAEKVVWVPVAYYRYRQTNPNASSRIGDYRIPFDRLREIRAIYERLDITNEKVLIALYNRTVVYSRITLFEEADYPESDPDIQALIREALSTIDQKAFLAKGNGIATVDKEYYKDFMGLKLVTVKPHDKEAKPQFSIVVPLKDDRIGLWKTIDSLTKQKGAKFEVIFVNCASSDRGPEIAKQLSEIDKRFLLIDEPSGNVGAGYNAGLTASQGKYVLFARPGVVFMEPDLLSRLWQASKMDQARGAEVLVASLKFERFSSRFDDSQDENDPLVVECDHRPDLVAGNLKPIVFGKAFKHSYLLERSCSFSLAGDDDGHAFNIKAMSHISKAVLVSGIEVRARVRRAIVRKKLEYENDLIAMLEERFDAMAEAGKFDESDEALRIARGCIVCSIAEALKEKGLAHSGQKLYSVLKETFEQKYGLNSVPVTSYCNMLDYLALQRAFSTSYDRYCRMESVDRLWQAETFENKRDSLLRKSERFSKKAEEADLKVRQIEGSGSYKFGRQISKVFKTVKPGK